MEEFQLNDGLQETCSTKRGRGRREGAKGTGRHITKTTMTDMKWNGLIVLMMRSNYHKWVIKDDGKTIF